jgi:hypothetical protein
MARGFAIEGSGWSSVFSGFLAKMKWWRHRFLFLKQSRSRSLALRGEKYTPGPRGRQIQNQSKLGKDKDSRNMRVNN